METAVYRTKIDPLIGFVMVAATAVTLMTGFYISWGAVLSATGMAMLFIALIIGYKYVIDGDTLVVYQFFRPVRIPIAKIREIAETTGYVNNFGLSRRRLTLTFTDRSVMKSSAPLNISPDDPESFIARLRSINPDITVTCER